MSKEHNDTSTKIDLGVAEGGEAETRQVLRRIRWWEGSHEFWSGWGWYR